MNLFVCSLPFGSEGGMWNSIVLIPYHCLSINFAFLYLIRLFDFLYSIIFLIFV